MSVQDIVYVVGPQDSDELRYSLRSLANVPHGKVWLAGVVPPWVTGVGKIEVGQAPNRWDSQEDNVRAACAHPGVADRFLLFNDDFYVVQPVASIPVMHGGPLSEVRRRGEYGRRFYATASRLPDGAVTYDGIHTPLPVSKSLMGTALSVLPDGMLYRTWYGNVAGIGGTASEDVKIRGRALPEGVLVSTNRNSFSSKPVGAFLRGMFPNKCRYER